MSLPDLIEIIPLEKPVRAEITVPGSKSITNRALILAALANGKTTLQGALWSEDTQVMVDCLRRLGFEMEVTADADEFCNRSITVLGRGGEIRKAGTAEKPLELFVGNAGTAARFLSALVCLGPGVCRLHGVSRMHERPQSALFTALRQLGYRVDSEAGNDKLPVRIFGDTSWRPRSGTVSIEESSQFASGLLLCARAGNWNIKVIGENAEESPYVAMTSEFIAVFPKNGGTFQIEPDASSGSYFWGAGWLLAAANATGKTAGPLHQDASVMVANWPTSDWQLDADFTRFIQADKGALPTPISRSRDLADGIMTAIVLAPFSSEAIRFTDLGRLRVQECERVMALRTELSRCGGKVTETGDTLEVFPSALHGAEIETYDDHRVAMCFAVLGLKVPGIKIKNPACVKKTFPNFFQKLAAAPPRGLGATILDGRTGRKLSHDQLFAD